MRKWGWLVCLFVLGCGGGSPEGGFTLTIEVSGKGSVALDHKPDGRNACVEVNDAPLSSCVNDTEGTETCVYENVAFNPAYNAGVGCVETGITVPVFQAEATPAADWTWDHWVTIAGSVVICDQPPASPVQSLELGSTGEHIKCRAVFTPPPLTRTLIGVVVSPANISVPEGTTGTLTATGMYSDNTTADLTTQATWASQNTAVVTVSNTSPTQGVVTAAIDPPDPATTTVTATFDGKTGSSAVTVTPATPVSLEITPDNPSVADGLTVQLTATMTYSDGSFEIVNETALWSASDPGIVTVSNTTGSKGQASGLAPGTTIITVVESGLTDTTTVQVTPATLTSLTVSPDSASIADGLTQAFTAMGTFTDGSMLDLTTMVSWTSSTPAIASIGATTGLATTVGNSQLGTTTITATMGAVSDTAQLTVTAATLSSLEVTPDPATIPLGRDRPFFASGTFTDGSVLDITNTVTWTATPAGRITITPGGLASTPPGATSGAATVTATSGAVSDSASVTVTSAELVSIAIAPDPLQLTDGQMQQLTVNGLFSDGTMGDVTSMATWMTSDMTIATVDSAGVCTAQDPGNATITAVVNMLIDTLGLNVVPAIAFWVEVTLPFTGGFSGYVTRMFPSMFLFAGHGTDGFLDTVTETAGVPAFTRTLLGQGDPQAGARPLPDGSKIVGGRSLSNFRGWLARLDTSNAFSWQQTLPNATRFTSFAPTNATTMTAAYVDNATSRTGLVQFDPATGTLTRAVLADVSGFTLSRMEQMPGTSDVIAASGDTVFRFDANLVPVWQKTIAGATINSLEITPAGQILLTRTATSFTDALVIAPDGQLVRATEYGPAGIVSLRSYSPTTTGFIATGTVNGVQTAFRTDAQGAPTVARSFADPQGGIGTLQGALENADGSIAIGGRNTSRNAAMKVAADLSVPGCADAALGASIAPSSITTATGAPTVTNAAVTFTAVSPLPTPTASTFTASSAVTGSVNACTN